MQSEDHSFQLLPWSFTAIVAKMGKLIQNCIHLFVLLFTAVREVCGGGSQAHIRQSGRARGFSAVRQTESPRGSSRGPGASRNCATRQKRTGGSHRKIKVPVEKRYGSKGELTIPL